MHNYDHLDDDLSGNEADATYSNGVLTISFKGAKWRTWKEFWISSSDQNDPGTSLKTRTPKYPAYPVDMHNYEVCVF